jgi:hypothetical protein
MAGCTGRLSRASATVFAFALGFACFVGFDAVSGAFAFDLDLADAFASDFSALVALFAETFGFVAAVGRADAAFGFAAVVGADAAFGCAAAFDLALDAFFAAGARSFACCCSITSLSGALRGIVLLRDDSFEGQCRPLAIVPAAR